MEVCCIAAIIAAQTRPKEHDMKATDKGPEGPVTAAAGDKPDFVETAARVYTTGVERLAEGQKRTIDLAIEHNAEMMSAWKKQAAAAPGLFMLDLATTVFDRFAQTHKGMIDLMVEQTHALAGLAKERKLKAGKVVDDSVVRAQEAIDQSVAAQKTVLDFSTRQTKAAFETAKKQFGYAGTPAGAAADSMQHGLEVVVDAQKELLDVLREPLKSVH
jgi:hypothetical protein